MWRRSPGDRLDLAGPRRRLPGPLAPVVRVEQETGGGGEHQVVGRHHPRAQRLEVGRQGLDDLPGPDAAGLGPLA